MNPIYDKSACGTSSYLIVHFITLIIRLLRPGGLKSVAAENLILKQQLLIICRPRRKALNLRKSDRFILGWLEILLSPNRLARSAVVVKPATLLAFHNALVRRKYRLLFSSPHKGKPGPKGPNSALTINKKDARTVVQIYQKYLELKSVRSLKEWLNSSRLKNKHGKTFSRGALYKLLQNQVYMGNIWHKDQVHEGSHKPILDTAVWNIVQQLLQANRHQHQQHQTTSCALLSGLLFDDQGNALSPTHTKKGNKRYYYYVSQALLKYHDKDAGDISRVSLPELDTQVIQLLQTQQYAMC